MASPELEEFLEKLKPTYKQYAQPLHSASFTDVAELAAATPELLKTETKGLVPIGPAGAIVAAARKAAGGPRGRQAYLLKSSENRGTSAIRDALREMQLPSGHQGGQQPGETAGLAVAAWAGSCTPE